MSAFDTMLGYLKEAGDILASKVEKFHMKYVADADHNPSENTDNMISHASAADGRLAHVASDAVVAGTINTPMNLRKPVASSVGNYQKPV